MKVYTCTNCHIPLYFENSQCLNCQPAVCFDPESLTMIPLGAVGGDGAAPTGGGAGAQPYRYCKNAEYGVCNWLIPAGSAAPWWLACTPNRIIPALNSDKNRHRCKNMEAAKHRLVHSPLPPHLPLT